MVDGATNTITHISAVGKSPFGIGINPMSQTIYVDSCTVSVVNEPSLIVVATLTVNCNPIWIGVLPGLNRVFVASAASMAIYVISP